MTTKYIRIVGGTYRRTPIAVIDAPGLRPTPDRVRETLFNWLGHFWEGHFADKRVLDLFAGSGALGFEAASRGAAQVVLVENDRRALQAMRDLREKLKAEAVRVQPGHALAALRGPARYDLVFLDPPFGQGWLERLWPLLPAVLAPGALVYAEAEAPLPPPPAGFEILRQDKAGAVHYHLLQFAAPQE